MYTVDFYNLREEFKLTEGKREWKKSQEEEG